MLIQCTKKLLDALKVKPENPPEEEALFCWHAHLVIMDRRKTVVLMNDQNRYIVVLHGLKAKDCKEFHKLVVQGIRQAFREEGIKEEVIDRYLAHTIEALF